MVRAAAAELVGTLVLVLVGTAVAVADILGRQIAGSPYDSLAIALAFGLVLVALVGALGHTSGCHLNPAVTLGLASIGKFPWRYVPVYIAAQMVGAVLAGFVLWGAYGSPARTVGAAGGHRADPGLQGPANLLHGDVHRVRVGVRDRVDDHGVPGLGGGRGGVHRVDTGGVRAGRWPGQRRGGDPARALGPMIVSLKSLSVWAYVLGPWWGAC